MLLKYSENEPDKRIVCLYCVDLFFTIQFPQEVDRVSFQNTHNNNCYFYFETLKLEPLKPRLRGKRGIKRFFFFDRG